MYLGIFEFFFSLAGVVSYMWVLIVIVVAVSVKTLDHWAIRPKGYSGVSRFIADTP